MIIGRDNKPFWSPNIKFIYPSLPESWNTHVNRFGWVSQITLGSNGNFFIKGDEYGHWNLHEINQTRLDLKNNFWKIEVCALGRERSYIVQLNNGASFWSLSGAYPDLSNWVTKKTKNEKRNIRVSQILAQSSCGSPLILPTM